MKIQNNNPVNFTRAFNSKEKAAYMQCISQAKKELGLKDTTAILFDYLVPSTKEKNIGIGSSFSKNAQTFVNFLKEICGINSLQLNPQGILKDDTVSPYSGTFLSIGEHLIDVFQLTEKEFCNILSNEDIAKYLIEEDGDKVYETDYHKLVRQDYKKDKSQFLFSNLLATAYENFKKLSPDAPFIKEFHDFCEAQNYRLEKDSLYYALSEKYGSTQWQNWSEYQNLFENNSPDLNSLKEKLSEEIDYFMFVQFIAAKQQHNSKKEFNKKGVKIYGDIPISFSPAEQWGNKSVFSKGYSFGYFIDGEFKDWGSPAPDMDEGKNPLIKSLFANRLKAAFERYDGVRIDAAWEMVNPCLVKWNPIKSAGKIVENLGTSYIDLIEQIAKEIKGNSYQPEDVFLELIGDDDIIKTVNYTKNKFTHTLITGNMTKELETIRHYRNKGYEGSGFTAGIGTHDNCSLIELAEKLKNGTPEEKSKIYSNIRALAHYMKINPKKLKIPELYRTIKLAELFTTPNQFFNVFDILGSRQIINKWDSNNGTYWSSRIPINYEKMYFKNLIQNRGLNLPEVLNYALKSKFQKFTETQIKLSKQLEKFAQILKEYGPLTEAEANIKSNL